MPRRERAAAQGNVNLLSFRICWLGTGSKKTYPVFTLLLLIWLVFILGSGNSAEITLTRLISRMAKESLSAEGLAPLVSIEKTCLDMINSGRQIYQREDALKMMVAAFGEGPQHPRSEKSPQR